jgi:hypothetical protein
MGWLGDASYLGCTVTLLLCFSGFPCTLFCIERAFVIYPPMRYSEAHWTVRDEREAAARQPAKRHLQAS